MKRSVLPRLLALAPIFAAACTSDLAPPGQLILAITTDMAAGVDFDRLQIEIRQQGVPNLKRTYQEFGQPGQEVHFPATFSIVSNDRPGTRLQLRIITGKVGPGGNDVGLPQNMYEIVTTVPSDRSAVLPVHLEWLCRKSTKLEADGYVEGACHEGFACVAGECIEWTVDASKLATYSEREVFGGGTAEGDGACFDTALCFSGGRSVTPDADCTFPVGPEPLENLNVALVPAPGLGGICGNGACFAPLDRGSAHGWTENAGRVKLPKKVCEALSSGDPALRLRGVAVSRTCASKLARVPTCGPWSTITTQRGSTSGEPVAGLPPPP